MLTRRIAQTALTLPVYRQQVVHSARRIAGKRFASSSSTGPIKKDGLNSMLVGAELLAGTVAVGYAIGWYSQRQKDHSTPSGTITDVKDKAKSLVKKATSSDTPKIVAKKAKEAVDTTKAVVTEKVEAAASSVASAVGTSQSTDSSKATSPAHEGGSGSRKPSSKDTESIVAAADSRSGGNDGSSSKPPAPSNHVQESTAEEEDPQQAAFNPETGEINWDCPCLGGMAHGPCGEEFKDAFSCFVYSEEEPKGQDCIEKFRAMQDCFRKHPEIYGEADVLDDDGDTIEESEYDIVSAVEAVLDDK